jgi:hypothetical protein
LGRRERKLCRFLKKTVFQWVIGKVRRAETRDVSLLKQCLARRPVYSLNKALEQGFAGMCFISVTSGMTKR